MLHVLVHSPAYEHCPSFARAPQLGHGSDMQANVWTEYISDELTVEYMLLPRLCALAEALWSPKSTRDWQVTPPQTGWDACAAVRHATVPLPECMRVGGVWAVKQLLCLESGCRVQDVGHGQPAAPDRQQPQGASDCWCHGVHCGGLSIIWLYMSRCAHALVLADSRHQLIFCIIHNPAWLLLAAGATYLMTCTSASVSEFNR